MSKVEICGVDTSDLKRLTYRESEELLARIKEGDEGARETFALANVRLVLSVIRRFPQSKVSSDDLFQAGMIGLMKSIDNFDLSVGVRFSTYAVPMIVGEIKRVIRGSNSLRVSRSIRDTAYRILQARTDIEAEKNDSATLDEIAERVSHALDSIPYRKDITLDDVLAVCEKAKADGKKGFIYRGDSQNNLVVDFLPILLSYGGWVIDSNNQPTVNTPEFKDAMNFYLKLIATGSAQVKDDLIASCDTGAGTMGVGWPGWYTPTADSTADYCAITGAVSNGGETHNANVYGVWTIGVPSNSQNKELATELLSYLMDKDVQKSTVPSGGVPCRYSSLQDPEILKTYPQYEVVCKALEGGMYRPVIAEWTQFYTILGAEMDNIVNGVKTVDQGLADAQTQLEALMK